MIHIFNQFFPTVIANESLLWYTFLKEKQSMFGGVDKFLRLYYTPSELIHPLQTGHSFFF